MAKRAPSKAKTTRRKGRAGSGWLIRSYFDAVNTSAGPHPYASLLGLVAYDTPALHRTVERGLAFSAFEKLTDLLNLPVQATADLLLISSRTLHRRKEEGRLQPDESDRLLRLTRVVGKALELFEGDRDAALDWLGKPVAGLGGATPLELSKTGPGVQEVERLLGRLEHGVFA